MLLKTLLCEPVISNKSIAKVRHSMRLCGKGDLQSCDGSINVQKHFEILEQHKLPSSGIHAFLIKTRQQGMAQEIRVYWTAGLKKE